MSSCSHLGTLLPSVPALVWVLFPVVQQRRTVRPALSFGDLQGVKAEALGRALPCGPADWCSDLPLHWTHHP